MRIDWNKWSKGLCLVSVMWAAGMAQADDIVVTDGLWKVTYMESEKAFRIDMLDEGGAVRKCVVDHSASAAHYDNAGGTAREVTTASFATAGQSVADVDDAFGAGKCYTFTFTDPDNGDEVTMRQRFYIYPGLDYMLTDLALIGDAAIRSNYLAPVSVGGSYVLFASNDNNRMLKVPYDNDAFGRYNKYKMSGDFLSYEVSALYEGESREGLILGSVTHDLWKSAVSASLSKGGTVNSLQVFSGVSTSDTRDLIPHGKVKGPEVVSARMFVGYFDDWRTGMETFADANNLVAPRTESWTHGTPFGWQSWGVLAEKNSYEADVEIADYYAEVLMPGGFCNDQGKVVFSLDAGDNMNDTQHLNFILQGKARNQLVGCYNTPFSMWCGEKPNWDDVVGTAEDGTQWKRRDVVLKANGEPIWLDGAYCVDPTHPYMKKATADFIKWQAGTIGFKYMKMDFLNCGMVQADSYYNPDVTTAVAAYNEGMAFIREELDKYGVFAAFSIAPLFPYQYANSRRVACDTWGSIGHSEYCMNAISAGWWTDRLFQYNDPDHLVLVGAGDQLNNTEGENRARFTTGAVTGMLLVADNFSLSDQSGRGWAKLSRERAQNVMLNRDINKMANLGRSFRPVYGYKEYNGNDNAAESFFMMHTDDYLYVAAFNYTENRGVGEIPLGLLDIAAGEFSEVRELWTNEVVDVTDDALPYDVPYEDVRVYRFTKGSGSGIDGVEDEAVAGLKVVALGDGRLMAYAGKDMARIEAYDLQGRLLQAEGLDRRTQVAFSLPQDRGMVLVQVRYADGSKEVCKTLVR